MVCGGTSYRPNPPERDCLLRWTYGMRCEIRSAAERNKQPNAQFSTFNFLIQKELFSEIRFNELLRNYGHEDTLFGFELRKKGITITHIDNPLYHVGIDTNKVYLEKTREGVENLKILIEQYEDKEALVKDIRVIRHPLHCQPELADGGRHGNVRSMPCAGGRPDPFHLCGRSGI